MKKTAFIFAFILFSSLSLISQSHPLYDLEEKLRTGDKNILFEIAPYFDSKEKVLEYLGHHIYRTNESNIAKRVINENCFFLDTEIIITDSTSTKVFQDFLSDNFEKIKWDSLANAYFITPLAKRKANVAFRTISDNEKEEFKKNYIQLKQKGWLSENNINTLIDAKDPKSLLFIAAELFKNRFNTYSYSKKEYIHLLQHLIGLRIGAEDEDQQMNWHIYKTYYPDASLNVLAFFSKNYQDFTWNEQQGYFENPNIKTTPIGKEDILFQLLKNENDSIALDAFTQLTKCPSDKVIPLANEYQKANIDKNWSIPIFPYKFLKQLVLLNEYCEKHDIELEFENIKSYVEQLNTDLSFPERRQLEDSIASHLTIKEITSFEYWSLIHENSWGVTYSAGRILDIFYSKNWDKVLQSPKLLKLYLKKSYLFDKLGIIGLCNKYLVKFTGNGKEAIEILTKIKSEDKDVQKEQKKALSISKNPIKVPNDTFKINPANADFYIFNLQDTFNNVLLIEDLEERENKIVRILSKINYNQIDTALYFIEDIPFKYKRSKYSFMESDWGFPINLDFNLNTTRNDFLSLYHSLNEFELYSHYLEKAKIEYKNPDNTLNYDKIYNILKFNVVVAFAGGGGGIENNEVYAIIKILELTHHTTLGYPKKLCNSRGIYGCGSDDRAKEWMYFIKSNGLVKINEDEVVSFNYE